MMARALKEIKIYFLPMPCLVQLNTYDTMLMQVSKNNEFGDTECFLLIEYFEQHVEHSLWRYTSR